METVKLKLGDLKRQNKAVKRRLRKARTKLAKMISLAKENLTIPNKINVIKDLSDNFDPEHVLNTESLFLDALDMRTSWEGRS